MTMAGCRLTAFSAIIFACVVLSIDGLQQASESGRQGNPSESSVTGFGKPIDSVSLRASAAADAIQDGDVVRRILKQRSTRGRPRQFSEGEHVKTVKSLKSPVQATERPSKKSKGSTERTSQALAKRRSTEADLTYENTITALQIFHKQHSHLVLPRQFVVKDEEYPKQAHGVDLARRVYDMKWWLRYIKQRPDRVADLNKLGFVWERLQPEWNLILEALITYRSMHDDVLVPSKFVVPFGDSSWSTGTWDIPLGRAVYRIRNRGDFLRGYNAIKRRDQLEALGFVWDIQEHRFEIFCCALRTYAVKDTRSIHSGREGALKIPTQYVIPPSIAWPKDLWGYPLGAKCTAVRQKELYVKGNPERLKILADIGFHIGGNDSLSWLEVVHAAAVYSQMHNRNLDVPLKFVVPAPPRLMPDCEKSHETCIVGSDDAWPWPEYLWGFPLGQRLRDIRVKGYYLRGKNTIGRRRQLDALGFNWTPKRGRRKRSA